MKTLAIKSVIAVTVTAMSLFWNACQKETSLKDSTEAEISFNVLPIGASNLKHGADLSDANKIILTIKKTDGTPTNYTNYELKIYKLGNEFVSQKITLPVGNYKICEFYVINSLDEIIFASPLEGSILAQNVNDPLPILFSLTNKESKSVSIEVLSTYNLTPHEFGLVRFPVYEVKTFQFLICVSSEGNQKYLSAQLIVASGNYTYQQSLDTIANNVVTLKDGYSTYIFSIASNGYKNYKDTLTNFELKNYNQLPLVIELSPLEEDMVADIDGNAYKTVKIGTQIWMAENLRTTKYSNGSSIPLVTSNNEWASLTTPGYCWFNNDSSTYANPYGALYNWYAVEPGNLCPSGWHVPTDIEWTILTTYLGGLEVAGGKLKEADTAHWAAPNIGATNETGFTALPGSYRSNEGEFNVIGYAGYWWSSSYPSPSQWVWIRSLTFVSGKVESYGGNKKTGQSVRCLKN